MSLSLQKVFHVPKENMDYAKRERNMHAKKA
jgi:hypothetical protein